MADPRFLLQYRIGKKANRDRPDQTVERTTVLAGSRPLADVFVPDRLVPQEAFELSFDGRRLELTVKGELSGVFVNGVLVSGKGAVAPGSAIQCGACLFETAIDEAAGVCTVTVCEQYLTGAVAAAAKEAGAAFALEHDGPQEQRWGRSPVLRTWNWIAAAAGVALLALFPVLASTNIANRGELYTSHQIGAEKGPKDCAGCHAPWSSNYGPQCARCHEGLDSAEHHPYARATDYSCNECHAEHRGKDANLLPPMDAAPGGWPRTCEKCHAGQDLAAKSAAAAADPSAATKARDRAAAPVERQLFVDGFSHADHRIAKPRRASLAGGAKVPEGGVPIPCSKCHERRASKDVAGASADADFALVPYEKCLGCHAEWRVDVHGRDQGGVHCFQCHERTDDPAKVTKAIRTAEVRASSGLWSVIPRRHDFAKDDCRACHVEPKKAAVKAQPVELRFRHDHHLRTVAPEKGGELELAAACVPCHEGVAASASLAGLGGAMPVAKLDRCGDCHTDGAPQPVPLEKAAPRRVVDMFHSVHTVEPGTSGTTLRALSGRETLGRGCLSCHVPAAGSAPMTLREGVSDCTACHASHEHLGSGKCALCHVDRAAAVNRDASGVLRYRANEAGIFDREKAVKKATAPVTRFGHFSPGHTADASDATGAACAKCHDAASVDGAARVADVAWPGATERACVECHARTRFHR